jgi:hypothetical protein
MAEGAGRVVLALLLALPLPGCGLPHPRHPDRPEITFAEAPLRLAVGRIESENRYRPPLTAPNVEHLFPVSLAGNARRWGETRLNAAAGLKDPADGERMARFTVERAEAVAVVGAVAGAEGLVRARATTRLEIITPPGQSLGSATADVSVEATIPPNLAPEARMDAQQALTQALLARLDAAMTAAVRARLGAFLK